LRIRLRAARIITFCTARVKLPLRLRVSARVRPRATTRFGLRVNPQLRHTLTRHPGRRINRKMNMTPSYRARVLAPFLFLATVASAAPVRAQVDQLLDKLGVGQKPGLGQTSSLPEERVASGLREALKVATDKSVNLTGRTDGYFGNPAIRIPMPARLESVEKGLRMVGYGPQADAFVLSMNRAAEQSAPAARQIILEAVSAMSFDDARKILAGGDTAATDFFRARTTDRLTAAFTPIVKRNMASVGVTRQFEALMTRFQEIPFMRSETIDLDAYVVGKALDGLFQVIGEQEKQIRANPVARTTDLLKEVFSGR
jgi:hypothetical protein